MPFGPPALVGGGTRNFPIVGQCGIPTTATAVGPPAPPAPGR